MKILIPDGNLLCYGIVRALAELYGEIDVGTASTIDDVLTKLDDGHALDLVLLDTSMPGMAGFAGVKTVAARLPDTPVIVTASVEGEARGDVLAAIRSGARGFIPMSSRLEVLRHALPLMLSGEFYIPASALRQSGPQALLVEAAPSIRGRKDMLTPRQHQILEMLAAGKSNKEIARQLQLIDGTVKIHVKAILRKLGVSNRTQAVIAAAKAGHLPSEFLTRH